MNVDQETIVAVGVIAGTVAITITAMVLLRPRTGPRKPPHVEPDVRSSTAPSGPPVAGEKVFGSAPDLSAAPDHGRRIPRPVPPLRRPRSRGPIHPGQWTSGPMGEGWSDSGPGGSSTD